MATINRKQYVELWSSYIKGCDRLLIGLMDEKLREETTNAIDNLLALLPKIKEAKDKK